MTKNNELYPYSYENQNAIKAFEETYPTLAEEFKKNSNRTIYLVC